jgi:hypothetical protein
MLAAGSLISAATAFRVGVGCLELCVERTPPLLGLAASASIGGRDPRRAQAAFRDDLIGLARDSAELSWRELRRGLDQFDVLTRPRDTPPGARPHRPYRVKL